MKKLFKALFKLATLATLLAILYPVLYFAWKMGQPLPQPEFNGLTYYQFTEWRQMALREAEIAYKARHPESLGYSGICEAGAKVIFLGVGSLQAWQYTLFAWFGAQPDPTHPLPLDVTVINFVPKWWDTYEHLFWHNEIKLDGLRSGPRGGPCFITTSIPTPQEFDAMKQEQTYTSANEQAAP